MQEMLHVHNCNYFWIWWDVFWRCFQKLYVSENLTYIHHKQASQTPYSNASVSHLFTREVILEFNMTMINTIKTSNKRTNFVFRTVYSEKDLKPYT